MTPILAGICYFDGRQHDFGFEIQGDCHSFFSDWLKFQIRLM
jgi:hypothetical protein